MSAWKPHGDHFRAPVSPSPRLKAGVIHEDRCRAAQPGAEWAAAAEESGFSALGTVSLVACLAELRGTGVTVNVYRPGVVDTAMRAWIREHDSEHIGARLHERFNRNFAEGAPITPEHAAAALLAYLAADETRSTCEVSTGPGGRLTRGPPAVSAAQCRGQAVEGRHDEVRLGTDRVERDSGAVHPRRPHPGRLSPHTVERVTRDQPDLPSRQR